MLAEYGVPAEDVWLLNYLFTTVLDGRNAHLTDGVQRALGRDPLPSSTQYSSKYSFYTLTIQTIAGKV